MNELLKGHEALSKELAAKAKALARFEAQHLAAPLAGQVLRQELQPVTRANAEAVAGLATQARQLQRLEAAKGAQDAELVELQGGKRALEAQLEEAHGRLRAEAERARALEADVARAASHAQLLQQEAARAAGLQGAAESLEGQVASLTQELAGVRAAAAEELRTQVAGLEGRARALEAELAGKAEALEALEAQTHTQATQLADLRATVAALEEALVRAKAEAREGDAGAPGAAKLEAQVRELQARLYNAKELEVELQDAERRGEALERRAEAQERQVASLQEQLTAERGHLALLEAQVAALTARLRDAPDASGQSGPQGGPAQAAGEEAGGRADIAELEAQHAKELLARLREDHRTQAELIAALQDGAAALKAELARAQQQPPPSQRPPPDEAEAAEARKELQRAGLEVTALRHKLELLQGQLDSTSQAYASAQAYADELQGARDRVEADLARAKAAQEEAEGELGRSEARVQELTGELGELRAWARDARAADQYNSTEHASLQQTYADLHHEYGALQVRGCPPPGRSPPDQSAGAVPVNPGFGAPRD